MNNMLLKNLLKEDPDSALEDADIEIGRARAQGWKMPTTKLPEDPFGKQSSCFIIDDKSGQLVYRLAIEEKAGSSYHSHIFDHVRSFQKYQFANKIVKGPHGGDVGIVYETRENSDTNDVTWFMDVSNPDDLQKIVDNLHWESKNYRIGLGPAGRLWSETKYISFWNKKDAVMPHMNTVFKFMKKFGAKPEDCIYEFIDSSKLYVYNELGKSNNTDRRSGDEIADLMKKQHLDPAAKKKLAVMAGLKQKANAGFEFQAQRDAMKPAAEGRLASPLLKDILKEDPNRLNVTIGQAATLKTKGFDPKEMSRAFYDQDGAVSFIYEVKSNETLYSESADGIAITHPEMGVQIIHYWHKPGAFNLYNGVGGQGASFEPDDTVDVGPGDTEAPIYALNITKAVELGKFLRGMEDVPLHGDIPRRDTKFIMGRFWPKHRAISFWRNREGVLPHIEEFVKLVKIFHLSPTDVVWEFLDVEHMFTFDELNTQHGNVRSDAEQLELMKVQHIDTKAKKKLAAMQTGGLRQSVYPGFENIPAKKDASMPALQELLSTMVAESPDYWSAAGIGSGQWRNSGALTFYTFPTFSVLGESSGFTHRGLMCALKKCKDSRNLDALDDLGVLYTRESDVLEDLKSGILHRYFVGDIVEGSDYTEKSTNTHSDNSVGPEFRDLRGGLAGRVWTSKNQKVISFWNKQSKVLKLWPQVQDMFDHFGSLLEDIADYRVDWIEREGDTSVKMTPASSIGTSTKTPSPKKVADVDKGGQMNFVNKMFNDPTQLKSLSKEQLEVIRGKMHVFDPEVKVQLMKLSGQFANKAAEIAHILGMSVAEFNHLTQVAEINTLD